MLLSYSIQIALNISISKLSWIPYLHISFMLLFCKTNLKYMGVTGLKMGTEQMAGRSPAEGSRTVSCRYDTVNFLLNTHNRQPTAHACGQGIGCLRLDKIRFIQRRIRSTNSIRWVQLLSDRDKPHRRKGTRIDSRHDCPQGCWSDNPRSIKWNYTARQPRGTATAVHPLRRAQRPVITMTS